MHVNPRCFITVVLLLKCITAGVGGTCRKRNRKKKNYCSPIPGMKISLCVKWDLGLNVSGTHLWDGGAVEWPLKQWKCTLFWRLIDGASHLDSRETNHPFFLSLIQWQFLPVSFFCFDDNTGSKQEEVDRKEKGRGEGEHRGHPAGGESD